MTGLLLLILAVAAPSIQTHSTVLQRFLDRAEEPPVEYRAVRHMEASNPHFHQSAWMDVRTEFDPVNGLRYQVIAEGGSGYIRRKVFLAALEGERKMWANGDPQRASFTKENYEFLPAAVDDPDDGLHPLAVKPKRKDVLLVEGSIFVHPDDGELTRIEGKLSKTPSFWTRRVEVVRRYTRMAGVRVPVSIESVAHVLIAGRSTFKMTYDYEFINGQQIGTPKS